MIHESIYEALIEAVKACGGTKVVAPRLWGEGTPDDTIVKAKKLATCLNPERSEKLSLDEVMHILRMARSAGHHGVVEFLCDELHYTRPIPVDPEDQRALLMREYIAATKSLEKIAAQMAAIDGPRSVDSPFIVAAARRAGLRT